MKVARHVLAIEMESAGVYRAAHGHRVPTLSIRGISDIVGFKRSADWIQYACHTAAAFAFALMQTRPFEPRATTPTTKEAPGKARRQSSGIKSTSNPDKNKRSRGTPPVTKANAQKAANLYKETISEWARRANLDNWAGWSDDILASDTPRITLTKYRSLQDLQDWLFSRIWPDKHRSIENSFENFRLVLQDFLETLNIHATEQGDLVFVEKFYKTQAWLPEEEYQRLLDKYREHVGLIEDLFLELTRAANHVCAAVRDELDASFRTKEGLLIVTSGPYKDLSFLRHRVQYTPAEKAQPTPYPGLEQFKITRFSRDASFGRKPSSDTAG
jgi:hypothetical protein